MLCKACNVQLQVSVYYKDVFLEMYLIFWVESLPLNFTLHAFFFLDSIRIKIHFVFFLYDLYFYSNIKKIQKF